jgi:hypothetical protein
MAIDGFEWDVPDTKENAAAFGFAGARAGDAERPAYPKVRVVTVSECASHAVADAAMGGVAGKGAGDQSLARTLYARLEEDWLLIADRNFFGWADWCKAADSGAALLWRVKADLTLPVLELLPDGSYFSVLVNQKIGGKARQALIGAARAGKDLEEGKARRVRVVEYEVPDRDGDGNGEMIALVTTITEMAAAPAALLAEAYHQRWEHEKSKPQCCHNCGLLALPLAPSSAVMIVCWLFSQGLRRCCPRGVWWSARRRSTSAGSARTTVRLMAGCR